MAHVHAHERAHTRDDEDEVANRPDNAAVYTEATDPDYRKRGGRRDVPGWGADLDPANRPAYPMERTPPRLEGVHWDRPPEQPNPRGIRVFHSTERPGLTPVWGSSAPPSGLSGAIRAYAFRFSENDVRHWFILMLADRVNVGEGLLEDLAHGRLPNVFREMGGPAEWRYNRAGFVRKALVVSAVLGLLVYLRRRHRD
jgi:hypothetical protein